MLSSHDFENASYHAVLGVIYKNLGEYDKAAKKAVRVFELEPENKEVIKFLRLLLGLQSNDPSIHASLAYVYKQLGDEEKAREEYMISKSIYLQAAANNPSNPEIHFSLAIIYRELGEKEKACKEAITAKKLDPENFEKRVENFLPSLYLKNWTSCE